MKRIAFLTGTRADWGKQRALVRAVRDMGGFEPSVFVTGMHMLPDWGFTIGEVEKENVAIYPYINRVERAELAEVISRTVEGMHDFVRHFRPDLIVVHGDRAEALAGAIVGACNGIRVAHIEGGEVSGSIDESFRHAITKLSTMHLVANQCALENVVRMGERPDAVHIVGSPDLDAMRLESLPSWEETRAKYALPEKPFALVLYHPVVGEDVWQTAGAHECLTAARETGHGVIWIYPNADPGADDIIKSVGHWCAEFGWRWLPSLRFDHFLRTLAEAEVLIGNSSAGIHEAPYYGTRVVNIGPRQNGRAVHADRGDGKSAERFAALLQAGIPWELPVQKGLVAA